MRSWKPWISALLVVMGAACAQSVDPGLESLPNAGGSGGSGGTGRGGGSLGGSGGTSTGGGGSGGTGGGGGSSVGECTTDADCANAAGGKVCDKWKNTCVGCIPSPDTCPNGQYCDPTQTCKDGCKSTADCGAKSAPDAGTESDAGATCASINCDTVTHECVGCCNDDNCPLGKVCNTGTQKCVAGCTTQHGCDGTKACCTGQCYDVTTDPDRCGACDAKCSIPNATAKCVSSKCDIDKCNTGFDNCNNDVKDGCEQDVSADPKNCGKCATDCSTMANVDTVTCAASKCAISKCKVGFGDCDKDGSNGCEVDLNSDAANCTACGTACPTPKNGTSLCEGGVCSAQCNANYGDCNGNPADCEADFLWDDHHCGNCTTACGGDGTNASWCAGGKCAIICASGYNDCDNIPNNGCEAYFDTDPLNCGSCGHKCPNTAPNCIAHLCKP